MPMCDAVAPRRLSCRNRGDGPATRPVAQFFFVSAIVVVNHRKAISQVGSLPCQTRLLSTTDARYLNQARMDPQGEFDRFITGTSPDADDRDQDYPGPELLPASISICISSKLPYGPWHRWHGTGALGDAATAFRS